MAKLVFNSISLTALSIHLTYLNVINIKVKTLMSMKDTGKKCHHLIIYHFELFMSSSSQMGVRTTHALNILIPSFINLGNDEYLCYSLQQIAAWLHTTY